MPLLRFCRMDILVRLRFDGLKPILRECAVLGRGEYTVRGPAGDGATFRAIGRHCENVIFHIMHHLYRPARGAQRRLHRCDRSLPEVRQYGANRPARRLGGFGPPRCRLRGRSRLDGGRGAAGRHSPADFRPSADARRAAPCRRLRGPEVASRNTVGGQARGCPSSEAPEKGPGTEGGSGGPCRGRAAHSGRRLGHHACAPDSAEGRRCGRAGTAAGSRSASGPPAQLRFAC